MERMETTPLFVHPVPFTDFAATGLSSVTPGFGVNAKHVCSRLKSLDNGC
ncbi:MAG: hypothetical protein ABFC94_00405 [Syntrophomonas sp.]